MVSRTERLSTLGRVASRFTSPRDVLLALRVMAWALVLPILKHLVPVRALAGLMYRPARTAPRDPALEERILAFARWAARLTRWKSGGNCLERGLIAYRYLTEAGARPTLVVGLSRTGGGSVMGHAWVVIDGRPAGESQAAIDAYTPVFGFGPDGALIDVVAPGGAAAR